jgi:hypothetical protein
MRINSNLHNTNVVRSGDEKISLKQSDDQFHVSCFFHLIKFWLRVFCIIFLKLLSCFKSLRNYFMILDINFFLKTTQGWGTFVPSHIPTTLAHSTFKHSIFASRHLCSIIAQRHLRLYICALIIAAQHLRSRLVRPFPFFLIFDLSQQTRVGILYPHEKILYTALFPTQQFTPPDIKSVSKIIHLIHYKCSIHAYIKMQIYMTRIVTILKKFYDRFQFL